MKVVWLCSFSNAFVRDHLDVGISMVVKWMYKLARGHAPFTSSDYGVWNTNAIEEFEKITDVELHVVSPCSFLKKRLQEFEYNSVHYHFFRDENSSPFNMFFRQISKCGNRSYTHNRRMIKYYISKINPHIVHLIGAENPQYSMALLDIPSRIPTIVQLQTLLNDPDFKKNFPIDESTYFYLSKVERDVLLRADFIGTMEPKFINIIKERIKPNVVFVNTKLAIGEKINKSPHVKYYDFVYFAADISKACDVALEAFGMAFQQDPSITLDIVGGYTDSYKRQLDIIIDKYGIRNNVTFEGLLPTHDDVLNQIRKARFALLPLKIDLISGTIREAMSNGLPVITTDTGVLGTQQLNKEYQCALISPKSDYNSLVNNMIQLSSDKELADTLRENAFRSHVELFNNEAIVNNYVAVYKQIMSGCLF